MRFAPWMKGPDPINIRWRKRFTALGEDWPVLREAVRRSRRERAPNSIHSAGEPGLDADSAQVPTTGIDELTSQGSNHATSVPASEPS